MTVRDNSIIDNFILTGVCKVDKPTVKRFEKGEVDTTTKTVVIGLDLSISETGVSLVTPSEIVSFHIKHPKSMKGFARCKHNADFIFWMLENINANGFTVAGINIEGYAMGIRGGMVFNIGENGGAVKYALHEHALNYHVTAPTSAKKFITGKGVAEKSLILKKCMTEFDYDVNNDNEADAFVLAAMMLAQNKLHIPEELAMLRPENLTEYRKEALKSMEFNETVSES